MIKILHLEDDSISIAKTKQILSQKHYDQEFVYQYAKNSQDFLHKMKSEEFDCVLLDMVLPDEKPQSGLDVLKNLRENGYHGPTLMVSSLFDAEVINESVRLGAVDFITKGMDEAELAFRIVRACQAITDNQKIPIQDIAFAAGETFKKILMKLPRIIDSNVRSLLVLGESGTGKEVVAQSLKALLPATMPFVSLNCASISKDLIESELFGHEKGAFTGADQARDGFFSAAHRGWIFLDEVARLSLSAQASLLRTLESGEIRRVGSSQTRYVDVRVLAATNEDLDALCEKGEFRSDLLARLRAYEILLPPLRERKDEVPEILNAILERLNKDRKATHEIRLAPTVREIFLRATWNRGNVREMWQTLTASSVEAYENLITVNCLPPSFLKSFAQNSASEKTKKEMSGTTNSVLPDFPIQEWSTYEDEYFLTVLQKLFQENPLCFQSQRKVSEQLGMSRHTLCVKLERLQALNKLSENFSQLILKK